MAKNRMCDLRDHLFATMESLRDEDKPMDIERAKAVCGVAEQLINSAKVECQFAEAIGRDFVSTEFFDTPKTIAAASGKLLRQ